MFSGIVERTAEVVSIRTDRQNKDFTLRADFCKELKIDQSIAHNGVCLTVVDITEGHLHRDGHEGDARQEQPRVAARTSGQPRNGR